MTVSIEKLTCGERNVRCLLGEQVDHIPFGVNLGWVPWGETLDRWRQETGDPELNPAMLLGFEGSFAAPVLNAGIDPPFESAVIEETQDYIVYRDGRGITLRTLKSGGSMPEWLDYPVKTEDDWYRLKEERLQFAQSRIIQNWDEFRLRMQTTGEAVQVGHFPYGVFGAVRDLMGVEEMLVSFYTQPEMIRDMMEHLTSLYISLWQETAKEVSIDHIHIWEDMSGKQGSLISPAMVQGFMMSCYDRIVEFGKSVGVRIISVDTDGDCRELVPIMMEHGINMFLPFEVQAGNDIREYRKQYPELGIVGGLDKRALAGKKDDIDREVEKAAEMIELGRYIPGFDHLIPPDVPWYNFRYAAEEIKKLCYASAK
ncbi:MAG: uroporphyrinogen decarboxylase family protein [Armatimonadota bacterium]